MRQVTLFAFCCLCASIAQAQTILYKAQVQSAETGMPIRGARIEQLRTNVHVNTDSTGNFSIALPSTGSRLRISSVGFLPSIISTGQISISDSVHTILLSIDVYSLGSVTIEDRALRQGNLEQLDPRDFKMAANPSGSLEKSLMALGASSSNELSSQYSVRGGNFDENLVYINGFEIYRPQLVRSGQQEGLSIINPDLVDNVRFSNGGFEAKYGDKMSSVLDVRYRRPKQFGAGAQAGLLGGSAYLEAATKNRRLTGMIGGRYRRAAYLLNSLPTKGDYKPSYGDVQGTLNFDATPNWDLSLMATYASNRNLVVPSTLETTFGTVQEVKRLRVYFDGQEIDDYRSGMVGFAARYHPKAAFEARTSIWAFQTNERERFDVLGEYYLNEVDNQLGSPTYGKDVQSLGVGAYQNYARNRLVASAINVEERVTYVKKHHLILGGIRLGREYFNDKLYEFRRLDSAGYNEPQRIDSVIHMYELVQNRSNLSLTRVQGFLQDAIELNRAKRMMLTMGLRANYGSLNSETTLSPRVQFSVHPWDSIDLVLRASMGAYNQPPFFRELRNLYGQVNTGVLAQKSIHYILGQDYYFKAWGRKFKFTTEAYYKQMWDVVPYEVDNVRLRYYASNNAKAYATGIDFRLNGQLVNRLESWASLSILQTRENLNNDSYIDNKGTTQYPGYIPRPTDQRVGFALFFQDYLPNYPKYKVNFTMVVNTGLPFGPPDYNRFRDTLRAPLYRRVDIGFSRIFISPQNPGAGAFFSRFKTLLVGLDIFNLLGIQNTISYLWVRDQDGNQYAIPQQLTARLINLRILAEF